MQNGAHLAKLAATEPVEKIVLVQVIGNFTVGQVAELVAIGQIVDGNDIGLVALVECLNEIAADESRGAGYDDRHARFPVRVRSSHFTQGNVSQP